jgi:hypothetical protein
MQVDVIEVLRDLAGQYPTRVLVDGERGYFFHFANYPTYEQIVLNVEMAEAAAQPPAPEPEIEPGA